MKLLIPFIFVVMFFSSGVVQSMPSTSEHDGAVTPKMRPVDRDWDYFKAVPCSELEKIVFHSRSEEMLLAKRKSQCVNKYKAFLPVPVKR